jgi:hypothetical protein
MNQRSMLSGRSSEGLAPYRTESVMSDIEIQSQPVSSGCTRFTLEEMIQSSTLSSNPNELDALDICGDFPARSTRAEYFSINII